MTTTITYLSVYEQRIQLVAAALTANSSMKDKAAKELAAHVLHAIDHIPEKVR